MEKNKLKNILACLVLLCMTSAFAMPKGPKKPYPEKKSKIEEIEPGPFAFSYPKDLNLASPNDFYFFGQFLLMQVKQDGMEYGVTQNNLPAVAGNDANVFPLMGGEIQGHSTNSHHWRWNYGCRLGCGFYLNHDSWNVEAQWTYIRFKEDTGKNVRTGELLSLWLPPSLLPESHTNLAVSERWTGNLNTFDLSIGKPYHVSRYVVLHPFFGLRAAWIEQDMTSRNGGTYEFTVEDTNLDMTAKNDFWAVGIRGGLNSEWKVGAGFSLFGNISTSLLFSHFDVDQSLSFHNETFVDLEHDFYTNTPNLELGVGLGWSTKFSKDKYRVSLKGLYEFHEWWYMNRMRRFFDDKSPSANADLKGDLMINGFSFAIQFDF